MSPAAPVRITILPQNLLIAVLSAEFTRALLAGGHEASFHSKSLTTALTHFRDRAFLMTTIMINLARTRQFQHVLCECVGDGAKQRPVVIDERWSLMLAVAHDELVA